MQPFSRIDRKKLQRLIISSVHNSVWGQSLGKLARYVCDMKLIFNECIVSLAFLRAGMEDVQRSHSHFARVP